jgi:hypothetical protein
MRSSLRKPASCARCLPGSGKAAARSMRCAAACIRPVFGRGPARSIGITRRSGICSRTRPTKGKRPLAKPAGYLMVRACASREESRPNRDDRSGVKMSAIRRMDHHPCPSLGRSSPVRCRAGPVRREPATRAYPREGQPLSLAGLARLCEMWVCLSWSHQRRAQCLLSL